jgi:hypothetical protein
MAKASPAKQAGDLAEQLEQELTRLAQSQFETPEFERFFSVPLTVERARFFSLQLVLYGVNRRDCWAFVQARAPWEVKADHRELMSKEAIALGATAEEVANTRPTPLLQAAQMAFVHLAENLPWLGALTASHFLERRNNADLMVGGGFSKRWRNKVADELGIDPKGLISSNVHVEADVDHSDSIWGAISAYVTDEESYNTALRGGQACAVIDRAHRAAEAHGMESI